MKKGLKGLILLLITVIFLYLIFVNINFSELKNAFKTFRYEYICLLIVSITVSLSFRALCFKQLIYKTAPDAKLADLIPLCLTGAGLNILLPARAGDIFRAYYTGKKYGADKIKIFGSVMMERLFDVVIIFCLLILGVFIYHKNPIAEKLCLFAGLVLIFGIIFAVSVYKFKNINKVCEFIRAKTNNWPFSSYIAKSLYFLNNTCSSFFNGFEIIDSPRKVFFAVTSSVGIWVYECMNYFIVIQGFGYDVHWSVSLFVIAFISLACMVPSTSIFIGPYQVAVIAAFAIYDVSKESALAISVLEQSIVTIFLMFIAFIFLMKNNISIKKLREKME